MTNNKQQTAVDFVPYELALELKQLGFTEPCLASYYHAGRRLDICEYINHGEYTVLAPTFSQAFRWFRDKYDLYCYVEPYKDNQFDYVVVSDLFGQEDCDGELLNTYEEAELACLKKLIEIIQIQNDNRSTT
jgi:hypothetical protein